MKKKITLSVLAMLLAIGALRAQTATKSVVYLRNGSVINCEITERQKDTIKFKTSDGSLFVYHIRDVEKILTYTKVSEPQTEDGLQGTAQQKLKRVGRDLKYVGARSYLDFADIHGVLGNDLYKDYRSAYSMAGTGAAFITVAAIAAGLGTVWAVWGSNTAIQQRGYYTLAFSGLSLSAGCVVYTIGLRHIGKVVDKYNDGQRTSDAFDFSPSVIGFNDITTGSHSYALGATLKINL